MRRPDPASAKRALSVARERLRGVRYLAADLVYVAGRAARAAGRASRSAGRRAEAAWNGLSGAGRRRLVAGLAALVVLLVAVGVAVPNLPCGFPDGEACAPADDAAQLVPADALAYVHASLEPGSDQYGRGERIAGDLPLFSSQVIDRALALVPGPGGRGIDFDRDLRPWFGGEAALAVLAEGVGAERVQLLEVADEGEAGEFAASIAGQGAETTEHEGIEISVDRRGIATAQVEGFLVVGTRDGVQTIVDTAIGVDDAGALADDEGAARIRERLPDERLADAYLSAAGAQRLVADGGALAVLAPLVAPSATRGAAAALVATDDGLELSVRSALDPGRSASEAGFFAAFPPFAPTLAAELPPATLGYVGIGEPATAVAALAARAGAAAGIAGAVADLVDGLRSAFSRADLDELLAVLGDEAALALLPRDGAERARPPFLELLTAGVDEEAASRALAALAPRSEPQELAGVQAHTLRRAALDLTYAAFDGMAAIAGDPEGIKALAAGEGGLDETELYRRATAGLGGPASLLAFVDLGGLIALGERLGLAEDPVYATFAGEFRHLEALAARVVADDALLATDARLLIAEQAASAGAPAPVPPPSD